MHKKINKNDPSFNNQELEEKVNTADPMVREYVSELQKENFRIQKLRAKEEAKNNSERNYFREQIKNLEAELKARPTTTILIERTQPLTNQT